MIQLPFSCKCTELKVYPNNWTYKKASLKKEWYIYYRFYDPNFKANPKFKNGKLIVIKRMNGFKAILDRQEATRQIIREELERLIKRAYNPITSKNRIDEQNCIGITPSTAFLDALYSVEKRISASNLTKRDFRTILNLVSKASNSLGYSQIPLSEISRMHIKKLLSQTDIIYGESAHRYNKIRSYLMILYKELNELEIVGTNPLRDISKRRAVQKIRNVLTPENRILIDTYLKDNYESFWRFMHIFFHSGARITELLRVKICDVDLKTQFFVVTIKKGGLFKEVRKPIKNIALPFWGKAVENASKDDYVFSKDLLPGKKAIQPFQITKRWNRHVKAKLGVLEDFYSLKHLNLDQTAELLNVYDASVMASHTSPSVTLKHYTINEKARQEERLKNINNPFV
jgi:integrase